MCKGQKRLQIPLGFKNWPVSKENAFIAIQEMLQQICNTFSLDVSPSFWNESSLEIPKWTLSANRKDRVVSGAEKWEGHQPAQKENIRLGTKTYFQGTCDCLQDITYSHCALEVGHVCGNPKMFSVHGAAHEKTLRPRNLTNMKLMTSIILDVSSNQFDISKQPFIYSLYDLE